MEAKPPMHSSSYTTSYRFIPIAIALKTWDFFENSFLHYVHATVLQVPCYIAGSRRELENNLIISE